MAAPEVPPPLRPELKIRSVVEGGQKSFVVKEPDQQAYYRFEPEQMELLSLLDGKSDLPKVLGRFHGKGGDPEYDLEALEELVQSARELRLLERTQKEKNAALLERLREERKQKRLHAKGSLLLMRFQLVDPDRFFDALIEHIRFFWSPRGVAACGALIASAIVTVLLQTDRFAQDFERVYFHAHESGLGVFSIWAVALGAIALHECGHGLTCKHFGGEVHEMGFLLLAFQPCLFCNVNDAWLFPKKSHKIYVALAGVWVELILSAIAAFVWLVVDVSNPLGFAAYILMTISLASSLFVNLNPLLKFDGYYILTDLLEIPNLRQNALALLSWTIKTKLLRLDEPAPFNPTARETRVYLIYGVLTTLWLTSMLSVLAFLGYGFVRQTFGFFGIVAFCFLVSKLLLMMLGTWPKTLRVLGKKLLWSTRRRQGWTLGTLAILATTLSLCSPKVRLNSKGTVDVESVVLYAPEDGFVDYIGYTDTRALVRPPPAPILEIRAPALALETQRAQAQIASVQAERTAAMAASDAVASRRAAIKEQSLQAQTELLASRTGRLLLPAPVGDWRVDGPPPGVMAGRFLGKGEKLLTLLPARRRQITVLLDEPDVTLVDPGQRAQIKLLAPAPKTYEGRVLEIKPVTTREGPERWFEVQVELEIPKDAPVPVPGMHAEVRILGAHLPLWQHLVRQMRKMFRTDLWA